MLLNAPAQQLRLAPERFDAFANPFARIAGSHDQFAGDDARSPNHFLRAGLELADQPGGRLLDIGKRDSGRNPARRSAIFRINQRVTVIVDAVPPGCPFVSVGIPIARLELRDGMRCEVGR